MYQLKPLPLWFLILLCAGCGKFRDSPFSTDLLRNETNLNEIAVSQIGAIEQDGIVRIGLLSDSHQNYDDLDEVIDAMNSISADYDFNTHLGDFTNSGYNMEYDQYISEHVRFRRPTFMVPGNHDIIGAGLEIYNYAFGPINFFFESVSYRFIFFNSNNLESPSAFHPEWLLNAVKSSPKPVVIFSHVPLLDKERFDSNIASVFAEIVSHTNTKLIVNGHYHSYSFENENGTLALGVPRVEGNQWLTLEIKDSKVRVTKNGGEQTAWMPLKN